MIARKASAHLLRNASLRCRRSKLGIQTSSIISAPQRSCLCSRSFSVTKEIVSANGIDFRVTIKNPDASHPVLCLPGALGTGASDFASLLKEDDDNNNNNEGLGSSEFGIYAFDPRGLGGSVNTATDSNNEIIVERDYPLDFYLRDALDAAAVMRALGIVDRYSVLGWSDGANAAVHLAAHDSTKRSVRNLVVWGGNAYVTKEDAEAWESLRDIDAWSERTRDEKAAVHGGYDKLQKLNDAATDGWINLFAHPKNNGDVCSSILHKVECPTLVLHGSKDVICELKHARYLARQIPDATLAIFAEGKHNLHQRHAEDFCSLVGEFLKEEEEAGVDAMGRRCATMVLDGSGKVVEGNGDELPSQPAIDDIAYGFMGSKALSVALKIGVFDAVDTISKIERSTTSSHKGVATFDQIVTHCNIPTERLQTLLSACVTLKLINRRVLRGIDVYSLPKASQQQLVRTSKRYWGDYIVGQVDAQFYTRMKDLDETILTGSSSSDGYEAWFERDPEAAKRYTLAQHNGSLATGYGLLKRLPELFSSDKYPNFKMLDVGGRSGAFSIAVARKVKHARCVVLDLPNVTKVAEEIISQEDENVKNRLSTLPLSATAPGEWENIVRDESYDVVLMSYVSGSIPAEALPFLYHNAYAALKPGGTAIIHDFFVDNHGNGPKNAALWALAHVTVNPEGMGLRPGRVAGLLDEAGFESLRVDDMIPELTQLVVATKPRELD